MFRRRGPPRGRPDPSAEVDNAAFPPSSSAMRYLIYFPIHLLGVLLLFAAVGAFAALAWNRSSAAGAGSPRGKKAFSILHGTGLFLVLLGGFGLMKVLGISHGGPYPTWLVVKFLIWLVLGAAGFLIYRFPRLSPLFLALFLALGAISATSAKFKQGFVPDRPSAAQRR